MRGNTKNRKSEQEPAIGFLARMTIKRKMVLIIMLVTSMAMLLAGGAFITYEWFSFRQYMVNDLATQAHMLADNSIGALSFDDPKDATEVLESLQAKTPIVSAVIYQNDGRVFATYHRDKLNLDAPLPESQADGPRFERGRLIIFQRMILNGQHIGTIYLQSDLSELYASIQQSASVLAVIILLSFIAAFALSTKLQRVISGPVLSLAETAGEVTEKKDYSVRAAKQSEDEVGYLIDSFNEMLTQIQQRDDNLRESESRFRTLVEQAADAFFLGETDGKIVDVNQQACDSLGYTRDELLTMSISDIDIEVESRWHKEVSWDKLSSDQYFTFEGVHRRKDGTTFPVEVRLGLLELSGHNYMLGLVRDITERKKAEEELSRLRNLLSNIFNSMPSVLVGVDTEGRVTQWNQEAEKATGVTNEKAQGRPLVDVFPQIAGEMEKVRQAIQDGETKKNEKVAREIDGAIRFSDVTIYPLISNGVEGAVIRVDDVTERVRIEEMMIQSEKMLSVGGLAAGMAHEINNPLAGILQNVQVMRNRLSGDLTKNRSAAEECGTTMEAIHRYMERRDLFKMIDAVMESGQRAAQIVENMLNFSRKGVTHFDQHDLVELLDKTVDLASSDYDLKKKFDFRQIEIIREYDAALPQVLCDASKIQQVFLNILKNGALAMAENKERSETSRFVLRVLPDGDMIRVEIEDNGSGMSEATRKRVFEPFFTTKGVGVGTGLGLSVSYFIIAENHGGTMAVESTPGKGAKFIIRLPLKRSV